MFLALMSSDSLLRAASMFASTHRKYHTQGNVRIHISDSIAISGGRTLSIKTCSGSQEVAFECWIRSLSFLLIFHYQTQLHSKHFTLQVPFTHSHPACAPTFIQCLYRQRFFNHTPFIHWSRQGQFEVHYLVMEEPGIEPTTFWFVDNPFLLHEPLVSGAYWAGHNFYFCHLSCSTGGVRKWFKTTAQKTWRPGW